jgi:hypothetical protein
MARLGEAYRDLAAGKRTRARGSGHSASGDIQLRLYPEQERYPACCIPGYASGIIAYSLKKTIGINRQRLEE